MIVLLIAVLNYVNLSTARSSTRSREIRIRKTLGASRRQLIGQMLTETIILTLASFIVALIAVQIVLPLFDAFLGQHLQLNIFETIRLSVTILVLILVIGLSAGIHPAMVIASIGESSVSGIGRQSGRPSLRKLLITIQFVLSAALIFSTIVVNDQLRFIGSMDLGYDKENIVVIDLGEGKHQVDLEALEHEILKEPNVLNVSSSLNLPNSTACYTTISSTSNPEISNIQINYNLVDASFFSTFGMQLLDGRTLGGSMDAGEITPIIINATAVRELGLKDPIGARFREGKRTLEVVGTIKDFHMYSLRQKMTPFYFAVDPNALHYYLSVKIKPLAAQGTIDHLKDIVNATEPNLLFKYMFFSDIINSHYTSDYKLQTAFSYFSIFALLVASIGLFGLISFTIEVRKKEIAIRKVLGASAVQISALLLKEASKLIVVACLIAGPLSYLGMQLWLSEFAYRVTFSYTMFVLTAISIYGLSLFAIVVQVYKASMEKPVINLRYE